MAVEDHKIQGDSTRNVLEFLFHGFQRKGKYQDKSHNEKRNIQILIITEYKKAKNNKTVPCETFSKPSTLILTNSVKAFKVPLALVIVLTHTNPVEWSHMRSHVVCVSTLAALIPLQYDYDYGLRSRW